MTVSRDPREEHVHVHVERERTVEPVVEPAADPYIAGERAAGFFTAQILWVLLIVALVVALIVLLASGAIDFGGAGNAVDPTAVP
jgi:hypothetical protein